MIDRCMIDARRRRRARARAPRARPAATYDTPPGGAAAARARPRRGAVHGHAPREQRVVYDSAPLPVVARQGGSD
jgi:hypothetical protein